MEDLLWAVTGYEGRYIKLSTTSDKASRIDDQDEGAAMAVEFALVNAEGGDPSLVAMARKFLPLAAACVRVRRFVEVKRRCVRGLLLGWKGLMVLCVFACPAKPLATSPLSIYLNQTIYLYLSHARNRYEYGMVAQALAAGLASVLREYAVQVAQLEHRHQQELLRRGGIGNGQGAWVSKEWDGWTVVH